MVRRIFVAVALYACGPAMAQNLWRVDNGLDRHRAETALRLSPNEDELIVAWIEYGSSTFALVHHCIGNLQQSNPNFTTAGPIPGANTSTNADPAIAYKNDGTAWIGAFNTAANPPPPSRLWLASKAPLASAFGLASSLTPGFEVDKPVLVAGPPATGGPDVLGLLFAARPAPGELRLRRLDSTEYEPIIFPSSPVGQDSSGDYGGPNSATILRTVSEPALVGRWVIAYHQPDPPPPATRTGLRPRATRGADGLNWANALADPTKAVNPAQLTLPPEDIHWFNPDDPFLLPTTGPKVLNTPSLATDPNNQRTMYVAFMGLTASANNFENIDLMIARSTDGDLDFSGTPAGNNVLHLTDADLGDPEGSVQFLPTVGVDGYGGVSIVYYVGWREMGSAYWTYQVKYARMRQFGTNPHPTVKRMNLTPPFEMHTATVRHLDPGPHEFFGDYIQSDIRKCRMWVAFPARLAGSPSLAVYVARINICVDADSDQSASLNALDPALFVDQYSRGDMRADLNRDTHLDGLDFSRFLESYSCVCNPE